MVAGLKPLVTLGHQREPISCGRRGNQLTGSAGLLIISCDSSHKHNHAVNHEEEESAAAALMLQWGKGGGGDELPHLTPLIHQLTASAAPDWLTPP